MLPNAGPKDKIIDSGPKIYALRVRNVPDHCFSWEIFDLMQSKQGLQILEVRTETQAAKKDDNNAESNEDILAKICTQGSKVGLQIEESFNNYDIIQKDFLSELEENKSWVALRPEQPVGLNALWEEKFGSNSNNPDKDFEKLKEDLDRCLQNIQALHKSQQSLSAANMMEYPSDLPGLSILMDLGLKLACTQKKSALVFFIEESQTFERYDNYVVKYKQDHDLYIHYLGPKKGMNVAQYIRQLRTLSTKRKIACENLEIGIFPPGTTNQFSCYWDFSRIKRKSSKLHFAFFRLPGKPSKRVEMIFHIPTINKFIKIEFSFKLCERFCAEKLADGKVSLYFALDYCPRFWIMGYVEERYLNPDFSEQWERIPHFALDPDSDELVNSYLAQCSVFKLTFSGMSKELEGFLQIVKSVGIQVEEPESAFQKVDFSKLTPYATIDRLRNSNLTEEARYAFLSCISQQKINVFQVTRGFFKKLQNELDPHVVEKTLKDIASKNRKPSSAEKNQMLTDLEAAFDLLYQENSISRKLWEVVKESTYMTKTKRVTITPSRIIYHVEEAELANGVLRQYKKNVGQFLRVTLTDEGGEATKNMKYISESVFKPRLNKLVILNKTYKFLAFSASQLRANSLWMLNEGNGLTVAGIHRDIGDLTSIKNPAKKGARLGQLFSASIPALTLRGENYLVRVVEIDDITVENGGHKYNFSDGVGKISPYLMAQIKLELKAKEKISAVQIRFGGVKGVLVTNNSIGKYEIHVRQSMIKFSTNNFKETLQILDYNKYRPGYLNRQIIILLLANGVDPNVFIDLQDENMKELSKIDATDANLFDYVNNEQNLSPTLQLLRDCTDADIEIEQEPFVKGVVDTIRVRSFFNLKEKSNILVKKAARLTGVLDEYGVLNYGQVYLCVSPSNGLKHDTEVISAKRAIVTKNPCLHPGDIRILEIVDTPLAREKFKDLVNCIVFPARGPRPHTDEISGSDLDGDMYFVSWDERIIPPKVMDPMSYAAKKIPDRSATIEDIIDFFVNYTNNDVLGRVDNSHLAFADEDPQNIATNKSCQMLAEVHAVAVDYAKTGICPSLKGITLAMFWPDYMEKDPDITYDSSSVLGTLYRLVKSAIETSSIRSMYKNGSKYIGKEIQVDEDFIVDGFENFMEDAFKILVEYYKEIQGLMNLYGIQTEYEIYSGNFLKIFSKGKNKKYNLQKLQEKIVAHIEILKDKMLGLFFKEFNSEEDFKDEHGEYSKRLLQKASALYVASYFNNNCLIQRVWNAVDRFESLRPSFDKYGIQMIGLPWHICKDVILDIKKKNKLRRQNNL